MFEEFGNNKAQLIIGRMVDSINLEVFSKEMIDNEFNEIYLGEMQETNKKTFHIGRIHFHLKWGLTGFCSYSVDQDELQKWKRMYLCSVDLSLLCFS